MIFWVIIFFLLVGLGCLLRFNFDSRHSDVALSVKLWPDDGDHGSATNVRLHQSGITNLILGNQRHRGDKVTEKMKRSSRVCF